MFLGIVIDGRYLTTKLDFCLLVFKCRRYFYGFMERKSTFRRESGLWLSLDLSIEFGAWTQFLYWKEVDSKTKQRRSSEDSCLGVGEREDAGGHNSCCCSLPTNILQR